MEIISIFDTPPAVKRFKNWVRLPDNLLEDVDSHYQNVPKQEQIYKQKH